MCVTKLRVTNLCVEELYVCDKDVCVCVCVAKLRVIKLCVKECLCV